MTITTTIHDDDHRSGPGRPQSNLVLWVGLASIGTVTLLASILVAFLIVNRHPTKAAPPPPHVAKFPAEPPPLAKGQPPRIEPQPKVETPRPEPIAKVEPSPEMLAAQPKVWEHRVTLAKTYAEQGQWDEAAAEYTKAIELKPDAWEPWSGRAFTHLNRKQWDSAVADFSKAIDLAPKVHTNWWHRGHAYLNLAQWDKAAADFGKVVDQWPDGAEGWYLRAVAMAQLKQPDKALADLRQAIAKGFNNLQWLKNDSRLAPLRTGEDFGKLVEELERKQKSQSK